MRLQVKGRNLDVTDSIRSYAEQKLKKLDKQLNDATEIELELAVEKNPSIAANQIAEATVWTKGPTLRAREASEDMRASIDQLTEKLVRQVRHYRDKRSYRGARNHVPVDEGAPALPDDQLDEQIVKTKQFPDKPMSPEEAVLQLELIGHDFFVFRTRRLRRGERRLPPQGRRVRPDRARRVSFRRREKPLHERLAEQGGMTMPTEVTRDVAPWNQAGVHGVPRPRQWDAVVTAEADLPGDSVHFVTLEDRTVVVDEDVPDDQLAPLADAVETQLNPPYRAEGTRRDDRLWAVGASKIDVVSIDEEIGGDTVELAVRDGVVTQLVDGAHGFGSVPELEALGAGMPSFVVRADRIDGDLWEVAVRCQL